MYKKGFDNEKYIEMQSEHIRERVEKTDCPETFKGFPITLISAGLLALAFMGFSGLKIF